MHTLPTPPARVVTLALLVVTVLLLGWQLVADTILVPIGTPLKYGVTLGLLAALAWLLVMLVLAMRATAARPHPSTVVVVQEERQPVEREQRPHVPTQTALSGRH